MKTKAKVLFISTDNKAEKHILMGKRTSGGETFWWLPGGSVEAGENMKEAVLRELGEELDLPQSFQPYLQKMKDGTDHSFSTSKSTTNIFVVNLPYELTALPIACIEEFDLVQWFPVSSLPPNLSREFVHIENWLYNL